MSRGRYHTDSYSYRRPRQKRRGGCLGSIQRFFRAVAIVFITGLGAIVFFLLVLLIAFNFAIFVQILYYALFVAAGLAGLGILYLIVRIITAISHRLSEASTAGSKAKIERERVYQERNQVRSQQAKLAREEYALDERYRAEYYQRPRQTRVLREHSQDYDRLPAPQTAKLPPQESPYRTRVLSRKTVQVAPDPIEPEPQESELELLGMPAKGQVFVYKDYKKSLKPGQLIIGIRKDGTVRIGSWQDFKITLILGSSSSGKSTTVLEKCLCLVESGGALIVCDPGGFKPDSLTQRIGSLQEAIMPGTVIALEHDEIMQNMEVFREELESRRRGSSMEIPILLVIDELNGVLMDKSIKKELTELLEKFAQQARGYNMYMILCAQRASGLAAIRNSVISYICHRCPEMEAEKILPARYARYSSQLGIGQTFVSDADGFIDALQQVLITPGDIAARASKRRATPRALHSRQTEPMSPRLYGAPSRQGKLTLRRTQLVQDQSTRATSQVSGSASVRQPGGLGAIWGEEPDVSSSVSATGEVRRPAKNIPQQPPDTENLDARQGSATGNGLPQAKSIQQKLDRLAEVRSKRKKIQ